MSIAARTSRTHPLQIASIETGAGLGRIGVTFCPGKKLDYSLTGGAWDRDVGLDLDAVEQWGAVVVVTLIEDHEFEMLKVHHLGAEVVKRHMEWVRLPIEDVSVPTARFESEWDRIGEGLRARLRDGFSILVPF